MIDIKSLNIHKTREHLDRGDFTSLELCLRLFEDIREKDNKINSYISMDEELSLKQAEKADEKIRRGEAKALTGIPIGLKDMIVTRDMPTSCASSMLKGFLSPYNASVVDRLLAEGAVISGKLNMDEFSLGSSNESSVFGPVKNPLDLSKSPGGSSGGCAASLAAGLCLGAIGSDTGGSIRQPAAYCGVVGLRPSYGRVSRYGAVAAAPSMDQLGPMALNTRDIAILLQVMAGHDSLDSTSVNTSVPDYSSFLEKDLKGLCLGLPLELFEMEGLDEETGKLVREAVKVFKACGASVKEISMPELSHALASYLIISSCEISSSLACYDGIRYGHRTEEKPADIREFYAKTRSEAFGDEVKRRIVMGTYALSSERYEALYLKALKIRKLISESFKKAFSSCDLLLSPLTSGPAKALGFARDNPSAMYLEDSFTVPASLAGIPAISLPCGFNSQSLPIALQLMARPFEEGPLLRGAYAYEQESSLL